MKKFEYKWFEDCNIDDLNKLGQEGWQVVGNYFDKCCTRWNYLLMREIEESTKETDKILKYESDRS